MNYNQQIQIGDILFDENSYMQQRFHPNIDYTKHKFISKKQYDNIMLKIENKKNPKVSNSYPFFQLHVYIFNYLFTKVSKLTPI